VNEDYKKFVVEDSRITSVNFPPKPSDWQCQIIGGPMGVVFVPTQGNEPNWFHRKMQELAFGFKWRKKK
jgi:hypothetical protein